MLVKFDGTRTVRVIRRAGESGYTFNIPSEEPCYAAADLAKLRYAQNGNMIFFAHPNYPPCILQRNSLTAWEFKRLEITDGPWLAGSGKANNDQQIWITGFHSVSGRPCYCFESAGFATADWKVGDIFKADFLFDGKITKTVPGGSRQVSESLIVKGTWEFKTSGKNWAEAIYIEKSLDRGVSWYLMKSYEKQREEDGQNVILTGTEDEDDVIYRARIEMDPADSAELTYHFVAQPFVKTLVFGMDSYDFTPYRFHIRVIFGRNT
jgi:hypothetical protein